MTLTKNTRIVYLYEKQDKKCYYCGADFFKDGEVKVDFNIDHKQPTSRGGKDVIENVALACQSCNSSKANLTEEEYWEVIRKMREGTLDKKDVPEYLKYLVLKSKFDKE